MSSLARWSRSPGSYGNSDRRPNENEKPAGLSSTERSFGTSQAAFSDYEEAFGRFLDAAFQEFGDSGEWPTPRDIAPDLPPAGRRLVLPATAISDQPLRSAVDDELAADP